MRKQEKTHLATKIKNDFFSLSSLSIAIGFIGFSSSIVTMFINVNDQVSIAWIMLTIIITGIIILILIKSLHDLYKNIKAPAPFAFENPIKYIPEKRSFITQKNDCFTSNMILGCYIKKDEIEELTCLAIIENFQEQHIQIKIIHDFFIEPTVLYHNKEELKNIIIRPYITPDMFSKVILHNQAKIL